MLSGDSIFQNRYTAQGGQGLIAFASSFPGSIRAFDIGPGRELVVQKSGFLASEAGVQLSVFFQKKLGSGFFGGEGFIMQRLSGSGMAFAEIDGTLVEYDLQPGQQICGGHRQRGGLHRRGADGDPSGSRHEEQAAGRRGPVQHGPYRPGSCMAADHAHLQCGGIHSSLYPHWEWLTNWNLRRTNLCAACAEKSMSRSNRQCAD